MKEIAQLALDTAVSRGAEFSDVRSLESAREDVQVKDGQVAGVDRSETRGLGVRVLVRGAWGYAGTDDLTREGIQACAARSVALGQASASLQRVPVSLAPEPARRAVWSSQCAVDPFSVPLERKLDLLFRVDAALRAVKGVSITEGFLTFTRKRQLYLSSEGSDIDQTIDALGRRVPRRGHIGSRGPASELPAVRRPPPDAGIRVHRLDSVGGAGHARR